MGVAYTSNKGGVYVQWGWRIVPMGVAYSSNGGSVYVQCGWRISLKVPKWCTRLMGPFWDKLCSENQAKYFSMNDHNKFLIGKKI